ncbi:MAG: LPS translocon maturation chaperone LptM [Candidatus Pelagibacterales bacterium]
MRKITLFIVLGLLMFSCGKKGPLELPETVALNHIILITAI